MRVGKTRLRENYGALSRMGPKRSLKDFLPILLPLNKYYHPRVSQMSGKSLILCDVNALSIIFIPSALF